MSELLSKIFARCQENPETGCLEWQGAISSAGYGVVWNGQKSVLAHRTVLQITTQQEGRGLESCHKCDNRRCCNPDHLWWGTTRDNCRDAIAKGRWPGTRKLSEAQAKEIKGLRGKESIAQIARRFGIGRATVWDIHSGRQWKHLD